MKIFACFVLLSAILGPVMVAQTKAASAAAARPYEIQISAAVAEKLLVHKVEICYPPIGMAARVTGTVVMAIEIDRNGDVLHPKVVTGPRMLQKAAVEAVRKYKYKPYLLNGKAVDVETTVSVAFDLGDSCPTD
jgi:protein TonB